MSPPALKVGLTGSVASGKSTVARTWADEGVPVVSADELAREVVEPGSEGLAEVVDAFGPGVLRADGTLDRDGVRERVFRDPDARRRLESILHPRIARLREAWMTERSADGAEVVVAEIPLLYETGREEEFDVTVVVHSSRDERLRRLTEERRMDPDEARRIMDAQMDPEEKRRRADLVLENDGSVEELRQAALALLDRLRERAPENSRRDDAPSSSGKA